MARWLRRMDTISLRQRSRSCAIVNKEASQNVASWHLAAVGKCARPNWCADRGQPQSPFSCALPLLDVRFRGQPGKYVLLLSLTAFGVGGISEAFNRLAYRP